MAEGGVEKRTFRTVLGIEEDGISTSDPYDLVVKDHGIKSGLQFDSVCITPVVESSVDETPEKTVQVLYTHETKMQGNLKFATVAVCEIPREINDENTVSKVVRLRNNDPTLEKKDSGFDLPTSQTAATERKNVAADSVTVCDSRDEDPSGIFASDPEALKYFKFGPRPEISDPSKACQQEGIFASDPEAMNCIRLGPKPTADFNAEQQNDIFASDPEAFKYFRLGPKVASASPKESNVLAPEIFASDPEAMKCIRFVKPGHSGATSATEEPEEIFASDPEALKYIKFGSQPKPETSGAFSTDESEGIFASDPEALKYIRFGSQPKPDTSGALDAVESEGIFASDPEALRWVKLIPKHSEGKRTSEDQCKDSGVFASDPDTLKVIRMAASQSLTNGASADGVNRADDGEGNLIAEATGIHLKDNRTYSVRVSGHDLPDGQQKKFVAVRSSDGCDGPTSQEMDAMQVTVETNVSEDGLVEKFIVVE